MADAEVRPTDATVTAQPKAQSGVAEGHDRSESQDVDADVDSSALTPGYLDRRYSTLVGVIGVTVGMIVVAGSGLFPQFNLFAYVGVLVFTVIAFRLYVVFEEFDPDAVDQAVSGDVAYRGDASVPGGQFDADISTAGSFSNWGRIDAKRRVVSHLREQAVAVVAHHERTSREEAREVVESGGWTDDDRAAELLAIGTRSLSPRPPLPVVGTDDFEQAVEAVVTELAAMTPGYDAESAATGVGEVSPDLAATSVHDGDPVDRTTGRWYGLHGVALAMLAVGFVTTSPALIVGTALLAGVVGYGQYSSAPAVDLAVRRTVSTADADPGEEVRVRVTVRNDGDQFLPDLRLVDGVPPALLVTEGSARYATALRPGKSATFTYTVRAERGTHEFDPVQVIARNGSGTIERERHVQPAEPTVLACPLECRGSADVPVHPKTAQRVGRVTTDAGGAGQEFHAVREYRRGDPLSRVDWNRLAKSGDLATQEFREEQAATIVVLIDARSPSFAAPRADALAAIDHQREAADVVVSSLIAAGDSVGLAALSPEDCWLEPRGGRSQQARVRDLLESHAAFSGTTPPDGFSRARAVRRLRRELPGSAQLVVLSPLLDDTAVGIARDLHASGYPVTVISPDVTDGASTGTRLARIDRAIKVSAVRRSGMRVVDWHPETPLEATLETAQRRWSQ